MEMKPESWHRRQAISVVAALPESTEDALIVLDLARQLVETFLACDQRPEPDLARDRCNVVSLSSASKGASLSPA